MHQVIAHGVRASGTAFLITLFLTPIIRLVAVRFGWLARPVQVRWGKRAVARLGGLGIFAGFAISVLCWVPLEPTVISLLIGLVLVLALGLVDDIQRIPPYVKLIGQLLIGSIVVISGIRFSLIQWEWISIPLSILWLVMVMNTFNLLDNMDGLAAGIGSIAAAFCAIHASLTQQWTIALLASIVSGSCLGFLRYNFPPAKIFMGDSGSHFLGLSLAALALMGNWRHSAGLLSVLIVPSLVLAVPIFDTCFVTIQRLRNRQHPFIGGKDHISHRLAILGLGTHQTVVTLYVISAVLGLVSIASRNLKLLPILSIWFFVATLFVLLGRYLSRVKVYRLEQQPKETNPMQHEPPVTHIETMLLHKRRLLEILVDFCLISSMYVFAYLLRFEGLLSGDLTQLILKSLPIILAIKLACFSAYGLYRGVWRYLGLSDIITIFKAVTIGSALSMLTLLYLWRFQGFSRSVLVIDWMLSFLAVGGSRVLERLLDEWIVGKLSQGPGILIFGAGDTGAYVLRSMKYLRKENRKVIGFLDDDVGKCGSRILGVEVLGGRKCLSALLEGSYISEVLIAINDPPGELLQYIQFCCEPIGVRWQVVTASELLAHEKNFAGS